MKDLFRLTTIGAATLLLATGCGQSTEPSGASVDEDSPEFAAVQYRQGLMNVFAFKSGTVRDMADGNIPVDESIFVEYATDLAAATGMITEGFIEGSGAEDLPGSNGLPDIWANWDDFVSKAGALESAASEVATLAAQGGFQAAQAAAAELGANCGACHRVYRQR